ncbi:aminotransferase class V-fold PLP-dependent enzyme [Actinomycetaceae bacterium TAE3-ERU4]|nr:aminotransferase class V-fold PLP-dependent enzyme [Actinomycetaceae bacterium TAE3-ERU4]
MNSHFDSTSSASFTGAELAGIRADFPILSVAGRGGNPVAYFDSAATSQKPRCVVDTLADFYLSKNAAVNRGTHFLGDESTTAFEDARYRVASFLGAIPDGLVWVKNATEALNLLSHCLSTPSTGGFTLEAGDEVVVTKLEHHANLVPWQRACELTGAKLVWLEATPDGRIDYSTLDRITERAKVVAFTHASNVSGAITDVERIVTKARSVGALTVLDSCQSTAHMPFNFSQLGVDFAVASSHKMLGPTGVGALLARPELLDRLPRFLTGGSMVSWVEMETAEFQSGPAGFEAGSQPVAQAVAWARALDYLSALGMERIKSHEDYMGEILLSGLREVPGIKLLGADSMAERLAVFAFSLPGLHPHDVGQYLDSVDLAVRVGHHCAIPLHRYFGVRSSSRASVALTTTEQEVERLVAGVKETIKFFGGRGV